MHQLHHSSPTTCLANLRCDAFVGDRAGIVGKRRVCKSFLSATTTGYKKMQLAFVGVGTTTETDFEAFTGTTASDCCGTTASYLSKGFSCSNFFLARGMAFTINLDVV